MYSYIPYFKYEIKLKKRKIKYHKKHACLSYMTLLEVLISFGDSL